MLRGQVVDAGSLPVPGATVMVAGGTAPTPEIALRCDAQGRFHLALPPGRFTIEAHTADARRGSVELAVDACGEPPPLCIQVR